MDFSVSTIVPTFGRPQYLERAVRSVSRQSSKPAEIIVVDDNDPSSCERAQTERLVEALKEELAPTIPLRYLPLPANSGGAAARNRGAELATGDLLAFLDDDDWWLPEKLEAQIALLRRKDRRPGLVYTGRRIVDAAGRTKRTRTPVHRGWIEQVLLRSNVIGTTSCALLPRAVFTAVGGFDAELPARQDLDLWVRIARRWEVDFVPGPLTVQTEHRSGRVSRRFESKARGLEMFLRKHRAAIAAVPGALAYNYFVIGRFYLKHGRPLKGRGYLARSLALRPSGPALLLLARGVRKANDETDSQDDR